MALPCEGTFPLVIWLPWPTDINRLLQGKNTSQRALWAIFMHSGWNLSVSEMFKESHNSVQNWDQKQLEDTISPKCWMLIGWGLSPSLAPRNRLEDTIHRAKEMRKKATCLCRQIWWEYSASSGFAIEVPFCQGCLKRDTVNRLSDCLLLKGPSSEAGWERENRFNLHSFHLLSGPSNWTHLIPVCVSDCLWNINTCLLKGPLKVNGATSSLFAGEIWGGS